MKFTGPVRFILSGPEALPYTSRSRLLLQQAKDRMGPDQAYWIRLLPNGVKITVSSIGGINQIWIDVPKDDDDEAFLHGFLWKTLGTPERIEGTIKENNSWVGLYPEDNWGLLPEPPVAAYSPTANLVGTDGTEVITFDTASVYSEGYKVLDFPTSDVGTVIKVWPKSDTIYALITETSAGTFATIWKNWESGTYEANVGDGWYHPDTNPNGWKISSSNASIGDVPISVTTTDVTINRVNDQVRLNLPLTGYWYIISMDDSGTSVNTEPFVSQLDAVTFSISYSHVADTTYSDKDVSVIAPNGSEVSILEKKFFVGGFVAEQYETAEIESDSTVFSSQGDTSGAFWTYDSTQYNDWVYRFYKEINEGPVDLKLEVGYYKMDFDQTVSATHDSIVGGQPFIDLINDGTTTSEIIDLRAKTYEVYERWGLASTFGPEVTSQFVDTGGLYDGVTSECKFELYDLYTGKLLFEKVYPSQSIEYTLDSKDFTADDCTNGNWPLLMNSPDSTSDLNNAGPLNDTGTCGYDMTQVPFVNLVTDQARVYSAARLPDGSIAAIITHPDTGVGYETEVILVKPDTDARNVLSATMSTTIDLDNVMVTAF